MALARIITRSETCAHELALHLLGRGYAVEIVSPDSIPDNLADLELRVDPAPGDRLVASVQAHNGERSTALDFVHYLKAPMADFIRRPPNRRDAVHIPEIDRSNVAPGAEDVELDSDDPLLAPKVVSLTAQTLVDPEPKLDPEGSADLLPAKPSKVLVADQAQLGTTSSKTPLERTAVLPWRAGLSLAGLVLLALFLGRGIRREGKTSAGSVGAATAQKVATASIGVTALKPVDPEYLQKQPATAVEKPLSSATDVPSGVQSKGNSEQGPKKAHIDNVQIANVQASKVRALKVQAPKVSVSGVLPGTANASGRETKSRGKGNDLVATDTVTYLDPRYKPAPKAKPANHRTRRHSNSHKRSGGVVAANSATYLNNAPLSSPTK